jgi:hypothetical protein
MKVAVSLASLCAFAPALAAAATHTVVIAGLGGEQQYEQRFREQATAISTAAKKVAQDPSHVVLLLGERATADAVRRELKALAKRVSTADDVTIVLIGHGSFDGEEYRFNLPGPDLTGRELGALFDQLPARDQLIVNATSASGAALERWQAPQRVIIAATKSGGERTATRFAEHWAQAVSTEAADVDKDQIVTAIEAYQYATRQVAAAFQSDASLATEHSRLEGEKPERFALAQLGGVVGAVAGVSRDPEVAGLLSQRRGIEQDLAAVKGRKASLPENEYYDQLEGVLVKLAMLQREIDAKQGGVP